MGLIPSRLIFCSVVSLMLLVSGIIPGLVQVAPSITSPPPGSTLAGSTQTFKWTAGGTVNIIDWWLYVGKRKGKKDIYGSGRIVGAGTTTDTVSGLPTDGSTLHVK